MFVLRPLVVAMGACLLQACMTTPTAHETAALLAPTAAPPATVAETPPLAIQPVMRVSHSANQSAATFYQLGKYHLERGNLDFARSAYEASITLDGQQLDARNALAALDATQGKLDAAKALLVQIVADFPEVAHPYNNLGYVYYLQSNFEAAERTLQRAIALDAGNERARNNLNAVNIALARLGNRDTVQLALAQPAAQPAEQLPQEIKPVTLPLVQADPADQPVTKTSEPVAVDVAVEAATALAAATPIETRTQGLAIISPPPELTVAERVEPQASKELVQIVPYVFELRLKQPNATVLAAAKPEKPIAATATFMPTAVSAVLETPLPTVLPSITLALSSRIEVANGNGVTGMAKRISGVLGRQGISVSRLSNELPYKQLETKIHYRAGFEKTAVNLKNALKGHAVVVLTPSLSLKADVRLVLGKDAIAHIALIESMSSDTVLAMNTLAD
jgi:Tfp pilus assembly protein PilF